jgi:hypothetical protein
MANTNNNQQIPMAPSTANDTLFQEPSQPSPVLTDEQQSQLEQDAMDAEQLKQQQEQQALAAQQAAKEDAHRKRKDELMRNFGIEEDKAELAIAQDNVAKKQLETAQDIEQGQVDAKEVIELDKEIVAMQEQISFIEGQGGDASASKAKLAQLLERKQNTGFKPFPVEELEKEGLESQPAEQPEPVTDPEQIPEDQATLIADQIAADNAEALEQKKMLDQRQNALEAQRLARAEEHTNWQKELDEQKQAIEKAKERFKAQDLQLKNIDRKRLWKSTSTFNKILAGIGMFLGAAGQGTNKAAEIVMNAVQQDVNAQKLDNEAALALRKEAFRRVEQEIDRMQKMTDNKLKQDKLDMLKAQVNKKKMDAQRERERLAVKRFLQDKLAKGKLKLEQLNTEQIQMALDKEDFKRAEKLRNEYSKETEKLGTREVINSYRDVMAMADSGGTGKTDIALLTKFMKTLDPGSVVREGEFHIAEDASPALRAVITKMRGLVTGEKLAPEDRKEFAMAVQKLLGPKLRTQKEVNRRYNSLARQSALPASLIVEDFNMTDISPRSALIESQMRKTGKSRQAVESSIDKLIKKGLLPDRFLD